MYRDVPEAEKPRAVVAAERLIANHAKKGVDVENAIDALYEARQMLQEVTLNAKHLGIDTDKDHP